MSQKYKNFSPVAPKFSMYKFSYLCPPRKYKKVKFFLPVSPKKILGAIPVPNHKTHNCLPTLNLTLIKLLILSTFFDLNMMNLKFEYEKNTDDILYRKELFI